MDQINLKGWEGRTASLTGHVSAMQAAMIHATLPGRSGPAPREGDPLPQLWHWCAFPPLAATEDLGRDGHTRLGDFLPPVALDRRMWAGGRSPFMHRCAWANRSAANPSCSVSKRKMAPLAR